MFVDLIGGFGTLFGDPVTVFFVVLAALIGIVFGALPGLTASAAIAMLLPLSFHMGALQALAFCMLLESQGDMAAQSQQFYLIRLGQLLPQRQCKMVFL